MLLKRLIYHTMSVHFSLKYLNWTEIENNKKEVDSITELYEQN